MTSDRIPLVVTYVDMELSKPLKAEDFMSAGRSFKAMLLSFLQTENRVQSRQTG